MVVVMEMENPAVVQHRCRYFSLGQSSECSTKDAATVLTHNEEMLHLKVIEPH